MTKPIIPEAPGKKDEVRQSRVAESRDQEMSRDTSEAPKQWAPPRRLSAPQPKDGMHFRWLRASLNGEEDRDNFFMRQREGFQLVKPEDINSQQYPVLQEGAYKGFIGQGGLVLAQIAQETVDQRAAYYRAENREQASKHSKEYLKGEHTSMPLEAEDNTRRVPFGR